METPSRGMDIHEMGRRAREYVLVGEALRAGVVDESDGSTPEQVAEELSLDRRAVETVMDALVSLGILSRSDDRYRATGDAEELLPDGSGRHSLLHGMRVLESWLTLGQVLETGGPVERERSEGELEAFVGAMGEKDPEHVRGVVDACLEELPSAESVLDLGGGPGTISRAFSERGLKVTLFDRPEVIELVEDELPDGITAEAGDFTVSVPPGPFDLAYLGNVCHIYGPATNIRLFADLYEAIRPGGAIAIQDFVRGADPEAELFAVNMLVNTEEGGTWTFDQFRSWLKGVGFVDVRLREADSGLVLAGKPTLG